MSGRTWSRSLAGAAALVVTATLGFQPMASGSPAAASSAVLNPDGTTTLTLDLAGDTWVSSSGATASQSASPELVVGSTSLGLVKSRSYLNFDYTPLAAVPAGAVVTSAVLRLSNFGTGACAGTAIRMSRVTGAWTVDGLAWSKQPAVTTTGSSTSTASYGASACPAEGTATFDASAIVKSWLSGSAKAGVQIKADNESTASGYRKYRSAENGDPAKAPTLVVTYDTAPATPTSLTVTPGANSYASSLTPTLAAVVSDPDGGTLRGFFEVRKGTTPTSPIVWSGSSDPVTSGEQASVTVPAGILVDGTIYSVAAYGQDGTLTGKPVAAGFKVDVTAPTAAITSNVFTNGQWPNPMPSSATFTLDGSADTGGFNVTVDGTPLGAVAANSTGDYTFTWTPTPGWHTLQAEPIDKAGNHGATSTFGFGTGSPAFALPTEWEGSTSDFPVSISAPPNATKAALLWRVAGETAWHTATHLTSGDSTWDGSVTSDSSHATTGQLVWHATQEALGSGTLTAPALIQVRGCFQYPSAAVACTADRYVQLVEDDE